MQIFVNNNKADKVLVDLLKKGNWDVNQAVDEYFSKGYADKGSASKAQTNPKKIEQVFNQYKDPQSNKIEVEGIQKFFDDIGVDPMDPVTLQISKHMNAQSMGEYLKEELEQGFKSMGISSIDELKKKLPSLYQEMKDPTEFKELYKFVFDFARDPGYKNLQVESAINFWELLLADKCSFLKEWIEFIQTEKKDQQVIQKDTWNMLYELYEQTKGDMNNYVDDGAWPVMIDQFHEFHQKKYAHK